MRRSPILSCLCATIWLPCAWLHLACACSWAQTGLRVQLAGRQLGVNLVNAEDLSPVAGPPEGLALSAVPVKLTRDSTVYSILQANGVAPDAEAFSIVYDLNPAVKDVQNLAAGATLVFPKVSVPGNLQDKLGTEVLAALTVDPDIRADLNRRVDELDKAAAKFAHLPADASREITRKNVATLSGWYAQIKKSFLRRTGPPVRRQTLVEMDAEAEVLNFLLRRATEGHQKLSEADQDQIQAIFGDVESEIAKYGQVLANQAPKGDPVYRVVVNIKGDDPKRIQRLRVYYTFNGIYRDPPVSPHVTSYPFGHLGSGTFEPLCVKNYMVWAAADGDPSHPLTPPLLVRVSPVEGSQVDVDISLAPMKP